MHGRTLETGLPASVTVKRSPPKWPSSSLKRNLFNKVNSSSDPPEPEEILRPTFTVTKFEFSGAKLGHGDEAPSECLRCLWPFMFYTRLLGMCPVQRKGAQLSSTWSCPFWINTALAFCTQAVMFGYAIKKMCRQIVDSEDWAETINNVVYYGHILGNTSYMIWRVRRLPQFVHECKKVELICRKYKTAMPDDGLVKSCTILFAFLLSTQVLGNVLYYISEGSKYNTTSADGFFLIWNDAIRGGEGDLYSGLFFCIAEYYCDLGWTFADTLLALVSFILTRYFIRLNREIAARDNYPLEMIEEVRSDHRVMTNLVRHCNDTFSPLFLLTYVANIGYLFSRLYTGLGEDLKNPILAVKIESIYAFGFQVFIKILLPSYLAARLHEKAHETLILIHNWPSSINFPDASHRLLVISRFATQVVTDTNRGISGCGYFLITKGFVVTLISALITYEIIILQFQAASLAAS